MEGITREEEEPGVPLSQVIYFFISVWLMQQREWKNIKLSDQKAENWPKGILEISLIHTLQSKYIILSDKCFLGYKECTGTHYLNVYLHAAPHGEYFSHTLHSVLATQIFFLKTI